MIYGIGTDLCDVGRIEKSIARPAFLQHVYTPAEQELIAARFMAQNHLQAHLSLTHEAGLAGAFVVLERVE